MKLLLILTLSIANALASAQFGGIEFHSSVDPLHVASLKKDLRYLYQTPSRVTDQDFLKITGLPNATGPMLHNWILNRVQYVIGETYSFQDNLSIKNGHTYPNPLARSQSKDLDNRNIMTVMTNTGTSFYVTGKSRKALYGFNLDGKELKINSPRVGLIQIGEGLFTDKALLNVNVNSSANSIARLGTLFHEARHSDGNGKNVGFLHEICPKNHPYEGNPACEKVGNGAYSVAAAGLRQLVKNCDTCSQLDKALLEIRILDNSKRVIVENNASNIRAFEGAIKTYTDLNHSLLEKQKKMTSQAEKNKIAQEITNNKKYLNHFKAELEKAKSLKAPWVDATPEGSTKTIPLSTSKAKMEKSILRSK